MGKEKTSAEQTISCAFGVLTVAFSLPQWGSIGQNEPADWDKWFCFPRDKSR
jgi:hypothetical protein